MSKMQIFILIFMISDLIIARLENIQLFFENSYKILYYSSIRFFSNFDQFSNKVNKPPFFASLQTIILALRFRFCCGTSLVIHF